MTTRKIQLPDGNGGWVEAEAQVRSGSQADVQKQQDAMAQEFIREAAGLTERLAKFIQAHCKAEELTSQHAAFAVALLTINMRTDFPPEAGGSEGFDIQAWAAQDYYDEATK